MRGNITGRNVGTKTLFAALAAACLLLAFYEGYTMMHQYMDPDSRGFVEMGIYTFILPPAIVITVLSHLLALWTRNSWFIACTVTAMLMVASFWAGTAIRL